MSATAGTIIARARPGRAGVIGWLAVSVALLVAMPILAVLGAAF